MSSPPTPPVTPVVAVPVTSSHAESAGLGLGTPHSLLYAQGLRFWGLDPRAQTDGTLPAGPVASCQKDAQRAFTLTNSLLGPPGLSSAWQLVEKKDGISTVDLDNSILQGPKYLPDATVPWPLAARENCYFR